jgi:2-methylcitrate dehydratase
MTLSRHMARFALSLQYEHIPSPALQEARRFLLDSLGCALAAVHQQDMQAAHRYIEKLGGNPDATVIHSGLETNAPNAALMNALLIRALDYNDIYWKQDPSHPSDIIPAALAAGEKAARDTRDLLVAVVIAYELEMRWCHAAEPGIRERGWHHATLTQFVSPVVAARMLGLSEDQTVAAIGISGSSHLTLGGVVAGHLTNMKNTADPMATEAGVRAALLAAEGYTGPTEVMEGKEGLFQVLKDVHWSGEKLVKELGEIYYITECGYKAFPTEALTHQPISAVLNILRNNRLKSTDVRSVLIKTTTRGADILSDASKYRPETKETADHSLPYCIAVAIVDGNVLPDSFTEEKIKDARIRDMLEKIKVVADPVIDALFPAVKRAIVNISTNDGQTFAETLDHAKGSPENPMSDEDIIAKFEANAACLPAGQRMQIIEQSLSLGKKPLLIRDFMKLLVKSD